jgi:hypothetical protein
MKNNKPREVYYDIQINNFESTGAAQQPLRFSESRSLPLIKNSGDYSLSIVRFEIDTYSLPTFVADIMQGSNTDPNKMIEGITMEWDDSGIITTAGPTNLIWVPSNQHIPSPSVPQELHEASNEYYYGNSFRHYCDLVNNTFESLTSALKTSVGITLDGLVAPKLIWNEQAHTAELLTQKAFYDDSLADHVNIYFNRPLYGKLSSFPAITNFNATDGKVHRLIISSDYDNKVIQLDVGEGLIDMIKTSQEYSTISNWSAASSMVFTTNTLPIVPTQQSEPMIYDNGLALKVNAAQNFSQVISDMSTNELCYKPNLIYVPSAEYRMIDMFGNGDISTFDINVFWKNKRGKLIPFMLQSGASASMKILFRLK